MMLAETIRAAFVIARYDATRRSVRPITAWEEK